MGRRGHSTTIGKLGKLYLDQRRSEIRVLGERLLHEQQAAAGSAKAPAATEVTFLYKGGIADFGSVARSNGY